MSYGRALSLQPNDVNILNAAKAAAALIKRENMCKYLKNSCLNNKINLNKTVLPFFKKKSELFLGVNLKIIFLQLNQEFHGLVLELV